MIDTESRRRVEKKLDFDQIDTDEKIFAKVDPIYMSDRNNVEALDFY